MLGEIYDDPYFGRDTEDEQHDLDDGYGDNEVGRAIESLSRTRVCVVSCGGWWLSPVDTWEKCPDCYRGQVHPEVWMDELNASLDEPRWTVSAKCGYPLTELVHEVCKEPRRAFEVARGMAVRGAVGVVVRRIETMLDLELAEHDLKCLDGGE
jgi:hypothetical protein